MADSKCGTLRPPFSTSLLRVDRFTLSFSFPDEIEEDFVCFHNYVLVHTN